MAKGPKPWSTEPVAEVSPVVPVEPRRMDTVSTRDLVESDSKNGPWSPCKEVVASKPGRRSWMVSKSFTSLGGK